MARTIDVERELAALRESVRRAPLPPSDAEMTALQKSIANLNANWHISAKLPPPAPGAPITWRTAYWVKRAVRRVMFELLNTLVQQQNAFNGQVARALTELATRDSQWEALEKRVVELEAQLRASHGE